MSKEKQTEEKNEKVVTRYDLRKERRKAEEEKERKSWMRFKIVCIALAVFVVAAIVISLGRNAYNKYNALHGTYVKVGDHEITQVEYDYYYNNAVNSYLSMYGSYVSLLGLDTTVDFDEQMYAGSDTLTWKDYFDQLAVSQLQQVKALVDDATAQGFTYDDTEDLASFESEVAAEAETAEMTEAEYYTAAYGEYATPERIDPINKENILANAYYSHLLETNQPAAEEITAYYEENRNSYDTVNYRSFYFAASLEEDASEEDITAAMEELKAQAEEMQERREAGEDFEELCAEYADEDRKENYGGDTDGSLIEGGTFSSVPSVASDWIYDDARAEGDISIFADDNLHRYYVMEFISKTNDEETTNSSIASTLASNTVSEYVAGLVEKYEVEDVAGQLKYLTAVAETAETESTAAESAETESTATEETSSEDGSTEAESAAE